MRAAGGAWHPAALLQRARQRFATLSVRGRMIILVAFGLVPVFAAQIVATYYEFRSMVAERESKTWHIANWAASSHIQFVAETERVMARLIANSDQKLLQGADCTKTIALFRDVFREEYASFFVVDRRGAIVCAAGPEMHGISVADRDYFREALAKRRFVVGEVLSQDRVSLQPVVPMALPQVDAEGNVAYIAVIGVRLQWLAALPDVARSEPRWFFALADRGGRAWTSRDSGTELLPPRAALAAGLATAPRKFEYDVPGGERYSYFPVPLAGESGLYLLLGKPAITATSHMAARFADEILAMAALCVVAFIGLSVATRRIVLTPLKQLQDAIRNYQPGVRNNIAAPGAMPPEFDAIGRAFLDMAGAAEKRHEKQRVALVERDLLIREIHHRIKNNLQLISSMLSIQARCAADPAVRDHLVGAQTRIQVIGSVHRQLYEQEPSALVDASRLIESVAHQLHSSAAPRSRIRLASDLMPLMLAAEHAIPLCLAVNEALTNSYKHAFPNDRTGTVTVRLQAAERPGWIRLEVGDNGVGNAGADSGARETGFGAMLLQALANQLDGTLEMRNEHGTWLILELPLPAGAAAPAVGEPDSARQAA